MIASLKSLSDNCNIYVTSMLVSVDCLFTQFDIFLVLGLMSDIQLKSVYLWYYVRF